MKHSMTGAAPTRLDWIAGCPWTQLLWAWTYPDAQRGACQRPRNCCWEHKVADTGALQLSGLLRRPRRRRTANRISN